MGAGDTIVNALQDTVIETRNGKLYVGLPPWVIGMFFVLLAAGVTVSAFTLWLHMGTPAHAGALKRFDAIDERMGTFERQQRAMERAVQETRLIVGLAHKKESAEVTDVFRAQQQRFYEEYGVPDGYAR